MTRKEYEKQIEDLSNSNFISNLLQYILPIAMLFWLIIIFLGFLWIVINF